MGPLTEWRAPPGLGCPEAASVQASLDEEFSRRARGAAPPHRLVVQVTSSPDGGVELEVVLEGPSGRRSRRLRAETCTLAARTAVLIASLVLDEVAVAEASTQTATTGDAASEEPPHDRVRRPFTGEALRPRPTSTASISLRPFLVAGLALGPVPDVSLLLRAGMRVGLGPVWGTAAIWWSSPGRATFPGRAGSGAEFVAFGGGLGIGVPLVDRQLLQVSVEGRVDLGRLSAAPFGLVDARTANRLWSAATLGPRIRSPLTTHVAIATEFDLGFVVSRPGFTAVSGEPIFRPGPWAVELSCGVEVFW